jgi:hypothetical protein
MSTPRKMGLPPSGTQVLTGADLEPVELTGSAMDGHRTVLVKLKLGQLDRPNRIVLPLTLIASPEFLLSFGASLMAAAAEALGLDDDED